jgi:cation-transporting ATPase 13A1
VAAANMALVENPQIKSAELLKPLPQHFHAYVWPFTLIWPIFLRYYLTPSLYEKHIGSSEWTYVWCGSIITLQALVWLSTNWSVNLKARFTASRVKSIQDAQLIKVIPAANAGAADICTLIREKVCARLLALPFFRLLLVSNAISSSNVPFPP